MEWASWSASGTVTASDVRSPSLDFAIQLPSAALALGNDMKGSASLDLRATGPLDALALSGTAQLQTLMIARSASIRSLVAPGGIGLSEPVPALALDGPPSWKLDVRVAGNTSVELANTSGSARPALEISGSLGKPAIAGSIGVGGFGVTEGPIHVSLLDGTFFLNPVDPAASGLVLLATASTGQHGFEGYIFGTLTDKKFTWGPLQTAALAGPADPLAIAPLSDQVISLELGAQPLVRRLTFGAVPLDLEPAASPATASP